MVNVTASEEVRLSRIVARNRENDPKTLKELQKKEKREIEEKKYDEKVVIKKLITSYKRL